MTSPILWQSSDRTTTLIDIPRSIEAAQAIEQDFSSENRILSSSPRQYPFRSNEPKSESARAKLEGNTVDAALDTEYQNILRLAIEDVRRNYDGEWCLPRLFTQGPSPPAKKRKLGDEFDDEARESGLASATQPTGAATLPDGLSSSMARATVADTGKYSRRLLQERDSTSELEGQNGRSETGDEHFFHNEKGKPTVFQITSPDHTHHFSFHVPPGASFYLADCAIHTDFHAAIRKQSQEANTRRTFNFILLDPPWPSRSVKRTHKTAGSTYNTSPSLWDIRDLILDTHLELLMAEECLVAMWITNKPGIRELVAGENGIFACWGLDLVEEWLWLKTTTHGEPVTPLDGLWRKPYEVLLLGRKQSKEDSPEVKRRVVIGVPDLHSRKPCLKTIIEPLMEDSKDYRALEVFARHLVAGWCSWGDECIKFNWDGFWRKKSDTQ